MLFQGASSWSAKKNKLRIDQINQKDEQKGEQWGEILTQGVGLSVLYC